MKIEELLAESFAQQLKHLNEGDFSQADFAAVLAEWGFERQTLEETQAKINDLLND